MTSAFLSKSFVRVIVFFRKHSLCALHVRVLRGTYKCLHVCAEVAHRWTSLQYPILSNLLLFGFRLFSKATKLPGKLDPLIMSRLEKLPETSYLCLYLCVRASAIVYACVFVRVCVSLSLSVCIYVCVRACLCVCVH
jgi:hypothetical protein